MFGFGKKKNADRDVVRQEFQSMTTRLRASDETVQMAVGHGINMAFSFFRQAHGTPQAFQGKSAAEQISYLKILADMETRLREEKKDVASSLGFWLFKAWVATLVQGDDELSTALSNELAYFSRKGDFSGCT
jgi:hypothetical protein